MIGSGLLQPAICSCCNGGNAWGASNVSFPKSPIASPASRRDDVRMSFLDRITYNPAQCGGRPCIRGMRIRVKDVLDLLAADVPEAEILADYPDLEAGDIKACLQYAAAQADHAIIKLA